MELNKLKMKKKCLVCNTTFNPRHILIPKNKICGIKATDNYCSNKCALEMKEIKKNLRKNLIKIAEDN